MKLLALVDFNLVATHGGFGRASRASGRPKATLSRRVMELEESLGVRLFERGARSLRLTEAGDTLFKRADELLGELDELGASIGDRLARPRGHLRISAPLLFAHVAMARIAAKFIAAYPDVRLEITADDRLVDLVEERYDLVIRANPRPDDSLVGRCIFRDHLVVAAAPSIVRPPPGLAPSAAVSVPAVVPVNAPAAAVWRIVDGARQFAVAPDPVLRVSSMMMVRDAAVAGAGAAAVPYSIIQDELATGRLVSWGALEDGEVGLWILHTSRRLASSKVTAFVNFLCAEFEGVSFADFHRGRAGRGSAPSANG